MKILRPWFVTVALGLFLAPVATVYAQSSQGNAVVLLASSSLPTQERATLEGLLEGLNNSLNPEDRIGVILFSDIVDHVSELAQPTADGTAQIKRVLDSLPAVDPLNTAVGIDRALELLSETPLNRSIILIGELDIRLDDAVLQGRYTRWLDDTLLPTAASEGIGMMVVAEKVSHAGLLQRHGNQVFLQLTDSDMAAQQLNELAVRHVQTPVSKPTLEVSSADTQTIPDASEPDVTPSTDSTEDTVSNDSTVDSLTVVNRVPAADPVVVQAPANIPTTGSGTSLMDRLSSVSMAPLFMLAAMIAGLTGTGLYFLFGRRKRRSSGRRPSTRVPQEHSELPPTVPLPATLPAHDLDSDATREYIRPDQVTGESRFDALVDSLAGTSQETLPVRSRDQQVIDEQTIETRTVDTARKRATSTADLTRELEELTRARNAQYDFE